MTGEGDRTRASVAPPGPDELRRRNRAVRNTRKQLERAQARVAELERALDSLSHGNDEADSRLFFVTGHAKSGTSWMMRILNSHPELACRGEGRVVGRTYRRDDLVEADTPTVQPSSLQRAILDAPLLREWLSRSVWSRDLPADEGVALATRAISADLMERTRQGERKRLVGDKTPQLSEHTMDEIASTFPGAPVVYLIRDGRDVAVSTMHHLWSRTYDLAGGRDLTAEEAEVRDEYRADPAAHRASGKGIFSTERITSIARGWVSQVRRARADAAAKLGERYIEIRYESMLADPEAELARVLALLGVDTNPEVVNSSVQAAQFEVWSDGRERGIEDSSSLLRKGVTGDWREVFTARDRSIFKREAGDLLIELGYERDPAW